VDITGGKEVNGAKLAVYPVDEKGNLYGFDIDVMNEAAKLAGYTVKWEDVDFDGIVPSVKQGKADIGIAGITYTEERAKQVDFSDVYYAGEDAQNYVLTMKSSGMKKTEDIKGKKIGTQMGTIQESILNSLQDEYNRSAQGFVKYCSVNHWYQSSYAQPLITKLYRYII
jgi:ABC-type amino acid transport substrate-binding protein